MTPSVDMYKVGCLFCLLLFGFLFQSSLQTLNWEDGVSTASSLSGAEEKSFKAACEQMNIDHGPSGDNLVCITWSFQLAYMGLFNLHLEIG